MSVIVISEPIFDAEAQRLRDHQTVDAKEDRDCKRVSMASRLPIERWGEDCNWKPETRELEVGRTSGRKSQDPSRRPNQLAGG